jgi:hypothetical protein
MTLNTKSPKGLINREWIFYGFSGWIGSIVYFSVNGEWIFFVT